MEILAKVEKTAGNYELAYYILYLQNGICKIADDIKMHRLGNNARKIRDITLKIEQLQIAIDTQKEAREIALNSINNNTCNW